MIIPKLRTLSQAAAYIKEIDPETRITEYRLRVWCKQGRIPYVSTNRRVKLIDLNRIDEYINKIATEDNKRIYIDIDTINNSCRSGE